MVGLDLGKLGCANEGMVKIPTLLEFRLFKFDRWLSDISNAGSTGILKDLESYE